MNSCTFIVEPPNFTKVLESKEVVKGSDVMLEGNISGSPQFEILWYKDSKPIRNDRKHQLSFQNGTVNLKILKCEAGNIGKYQCTVANEVGKSCCDCEVALKG